jgi:hypothetical protein
VTIHEGAVFQGHCHSGKPRKDRPDQLPQLRPIGDEQRLQAEKETGDQSIKSA